MKSNWLPLLFAGSAGVLSFYANAAPGFDLLVGTYTGAGSKDIYRYAFGSATGQIDQTSELLVFSVDPATGTLQEIQRRSVGGTEPREFTFDPDGNFVVIASQKSDQLVALARDAASGKLGETVQKFDINSPLDVKFLR
jgi:6-phosphogluconolactonase (cycloisomerase 2 family)